MDERPSNTPSARVDVRFLQPSIRRVSWDTTYPQRWSVSYHRQHLHNSMDTEILEEINQGKANFQHPERSSQSPPFTTFNTSKPMPYPLSPTTAKQP